MVDAPVRRSWSKPSSEYIPAKSEGTAVSARAGPPAAPMCRAAQDNVTRRTEMRAVRATAVGPPYQRPGDGSGTEAQMICLDEYWIAMPVRSLVRSQYFGFRCAEGAPTSRCAHG